MKNIGIYVHIPFCVSKCLYCNFYSKVCNNEIKNKYISSLCKEIKNESEKYKDCLIDTIYIGGGTPSILMPDMISLIINTIKQNYSVLNNVEITMEANPNTITYDKANIWFLAGINRISVGLQTSNNKLLKLIGRSHTYKDYINGINILKKVGFTNINTDIMIGLPYQKQSDLKHTIKYIANLGIKHISAYTLILEKDTKLYDMVASKQIDLPKEENVVKMFNFLLKTLKKYNYNRYEVSNFCLDNNVCLHNYNCWEMHEYVGFGVTAHSYFNGNRFSNISNIDNYIDNINNNISVVKENSKLTKTEKFEETIMLGLRLAKGIDLKKLKQDFDIDLLKLKKNIIKTYENLGLIAIKNNYLFATNKGFFVLNKIILDLVY